MYITTIEEKWPASIRFEDKKFILYEWNPNLFKFTGQEEQQHIRDLHKYWGSIITLTQVINGQIHRSIYVADHFFDSNNGQYYKVTE